MQTKRPPLTLSVLAGVVLLATTLAGCGSGAVKDPAGQSSSKPSAAASTSAGNGGGSDPVPEPAKVVLTPSVDKGDEGVKVDTVVSVKAKEGKVSKVKLWTKVKDKQGESETRVVKGQVSRDGTTWKANSLLDPGAKYRLEMQGVSASNQAMVTSMSTFRTEKLGLDEQTFPTFYPKKGATVGVGMPVMLTFDVAVKNRKEFEKHLKVTSSSKQEGSWHWYDSKTVHFRPKVYWKPGTKVSAVANLNGVSAGNGVYGQSSARTSFTVDTSVVTKVNLKTHKAKVYVNGKLARTIPVSGGKKGWQTRSGTKLISQKLRVTRMTNEAIGASEEYDFKVPYAMRVTTSGEFLHAAPWKEGKGHFGNRNTSHGCIGMSTANAKWLFNKVRLGDPVVTTGTSRSLNQGNGWTDWDMSYKKYHKGSAL